MNAISEADLKTKNLIAKKHEWMSLKQIIVCGIINSNCELN